MDDPQQFERAHPWLEKAFVQMLRRIYADTALSLGVSQEMCDYLAAHFGKPSTVFHFGPPDCMRPRPPDSSRTLKSSPNLTLGYAGSMSLGYREGILALLGALEATGTRLNVYTKEQHFLIGHPLVTNRGFLPTEALWAAVQAECDAVLLPYAFTGEIQRVYRTHFPTKLSEYCWVGMPMLLTGPADATGIRWGLRHPEAAMTATSPDPQCIGPLLERLCADASLRAALAQGAERVARAEFDPVHIRQRFVALLRQAAAGAASRSV